MSHAVLIIEDETTLSKNMKVYLDRFEYEVHTAATGEEGIQKFESVKPDVVLLDIRLPGMTGLEVLFQIRKLDSQVKVIMITAHGNVQTAVEAMKSGAYDYLSKPMVLAELKILLDKAVGQTRIEGALSYYREKEASDSGLGKFIGESSPVRELKKQIRQLIESERRLTDGEPPAVLITGETGTGKELVARALHYNGPREGEPFVEINCTSIPVHLLESELFGYERGAFTDAKGRKMGLFESADGGTLFLDEIGDIEPVFQAKLLKVIEDKVVRRLGSLRDRRINVRIITATNRPLEEWVRQGKFREDLYFRIGIIILKIPPLRKRGRDILLLANHFLDLYCRRYGKKRPSIGSEAEKVLLGYSWPGNVRELRNVIERTVLLNHEEVIEPNHLSLNLSLEKESDVQVEGPFDTGRFSLPSEGISLESVERNMVAQALERTSGNVTKAAKLLGLSRDTLRYRMEKYKIEPTL